jgi:Amidohydrolase family
LIFRLTNRWKQTDSPVRRGLVCLVAVFLLCGQCTAPFAAQPEQMIALVGGTLIDGNGGEPIRNALVLIKGNKIIHAGKQTTYPKTARIIDTKGKFILPGLIDLHVHYNDWMGELFLAHGVTTVKDLGNDTQWISRISQQVEEGKIRGPRIFFVGDGLDAPPASIEHHHVALDNSRMAQRAVTILHDSGASAIKVREKITPELLRAITERAHQLGIPVTGHLRRTDAREAALAGIDGLEHATGILQALGKRPRESEPGQNELQSFVADLKAFSQIEESEANELITFLAKKNVALLPTMSIFWRMGSDRRDDFAREDAEYAKMPSLVYVPQDMRKIWETSAFFNLKDPDLGQVRAGYRKLQGLLMRYYKAGGKVLPASDTSISVPGLSLHRELLMLIDAGFTPMQAITSATRDNARFLGKGRDLGTISAGKLADMIVVNANPLDDIRNARALEMVIKDGQLIDTTYHADYSIPNPRPAPARPLWLEQQLKNSEKSKTSGPQQRRKSAVAAGKE